MEEEKLISVAMNRDVWVVLLRPWPNYLSESDQPVKYDGALQCQRIFSAALGTPLALNYDYVTFNCFLNFLVVDCDIPVHWGHELQAHGAYARFLASSLPSPTRQDHLLLDCLQDRDTHIHHAAWELIISFKNIGRRVLYFLKIFAC